MAAVQLTADGLHPLYGLPWLRRQQRLPGKPCQGAGPLVRKQDPQLAALIALNDEMPDAPAIPLLLFHTHRPTLSQIIPPHNPKGFLSSLIYHRGGKKSTVFSLRGQAVPLHTRWRSGNFRQLVGYATYHPGNFCYNIKSSGANCPGGWEGTRCLIPTPQKKRWPSP